MMTDTRTGMVTDMRADQINNIKLKGEQLMQKYIADRAIDVAKYIVESKCTIRQAARKFKISRNTIQKDIYKRLLEIDPDLYADVRTVFEENKSQNHIRGGEATRLRWKLVNAINERIQSELEMCCDNN